VREQNFRLLLGNPRDRNLSEIPHAQMRKGQVIQLSPKPGASWSKTRDEQMATLEPQLIRQALDGKSTSQRPRGCSAFTRATLTRLESGAQNTHYPNLAADRQTASL
jgi:hypothetical protein